MRDLNITVSLTSRSDESLNRYLADLSQIALIDSKEEVLLARKIRDGDLAAEQKLICSNLRFVVSCAKKYQNNGLCLSDLIAEGNVGLIKAARLFDETRGFKFISYAVWWIRQTIIHAIGEHKRLVRLPMNQQLGMNHIRNQSGFLEQTLEREPTVAELAEVTGKPEAQLADFMFCNTKMIYLEDVIPGATQNNTLKENLADQSGNLAEDWITQDFQHHQVQAMLARLKPRERQILSLTFGIGTTQLIESDLAAVMNLSKERVRQLKLLALKKLKAYARD